MGRDGESGTQEYIQEEKKTFMSKQAYTQHKIKKLTKRKLQTWISQRFEAVKQCNVN